jgi:repressor LexA
MLKKITKSQKIVLDAYNNFIDKFNRTPTYREISEQIGINPSAIYTHVKNLEQNGLIEKLGKNISITNDVLSVPLLGTIACGKPISVFENMDHFIELPKSTYRYGQFYALRAVWDSMRDAGIKSWDILIIRQQSDVDDWDIAVVILGEYSDEERATLKRVYKTPQAMILKPANDSFPTQIITWPSEVRWKLISVIRNY